MIHRFLLSTVKFIQVSILLNKSNEVSLHLATDLCLPFLHRRAMLLEDLLVQFERLSDIRGTLAEIIRSELRKIRFFFDQIRVIIDSVHDDMEECDCPTRVLGVLFHEENILTDLVRCAGLRLLFLVILLELVDLEEEDETDDWLA